MTEIESLITEAALAYSQGYLTDFAAVAEQVRAVAFSQQPPAGWISVEDEMPEPHIEVLCAGRGWADAFVSCCYYDDDKEGWWMIGTHWTDAHEGQQYPTHWQPLPAPPQEAHD